MTQKEEFLEFVEKETENDRWFAAIFAVDKETGEQRLHTTTCKFPTDLFLCALNKISEHMMSRVETASEPDPLPMAEAFPWMTEAGNEDE